MHRILRKFGMMKALIIDDESKARSLLEAILKQKCPVITEILLASDLPSGVKLIRKESPNLIFLDIEMPKYSGLQLLDFFEPEEINFEIVFTTAYSEYAIKAFELNAISYLLKPLQPLQVEESVEKALKFINKSQISEKLIELKHSFENNNFTKIGLPVSEGILFLEFQDIILCKADGMYTKVQTKSNGDILISKPLKFIVDQLHQVSTFFRPHRSYIININFIKQFVRTDGNYILMENGCEVSLSKEKKQEFLNLVSL